MKEIVIASQIGSDFTASRLRSELSTANGGPVQLSINSGGGSVFDGKEQIDMIRNYRGTVTARITGLAASMASAIAASCHYVITTDQSTFMIHRASGMAAGNRNDMEKMRDVLEGLDVQLAELYSAKSGRPVPEILELMDAETWYYGAEIVEAGFADEFEETGRTRDRETALADARDRFAACYRPPTPYEVAAFAGTVQTPAKKTRILTREDIQAAELAEMDIEEYFFWLDKIEGEN